MGILTHDDEGVLKNCSKSNSRFNSMWFKSVGKSSPFSHKIFKQ